MAASIRERFGKNLTRILLDLKAKGVLQRDLARRLDVQTAQISHWKAGAIPEIDQVQKLLDVLNEYLPVEPEDLFENPLKELARREGYKLVKEP